ncbi:MAG: YbeD family protein [Woeseiaceae bacterium]
MTDQPEIELEFPQPFAIKAMGKNDATFAEHAQALILAHGELSGDDSIKTRDSKNGKFLSVTIEITATSREQLDKIYQSLTDDERVIMAF